jgi:hypothetical protein
MTTPKNLRDFAHDILQASSVLDRAVDAFAAHAKGLVDGLKVGDDISRSVLADLTDADTLVCLVASCALLDANYRCARRVADSLLDTSDGARGAEFCRSVISAAGRAIADVRAGGGRVDPAAAVLQVAAEVVAAAPAK